MPPPDSTHIPQLIPDSLRSPAADSLIRDYFSSIAARGEHPHYLLPQWLMFLIIVSVILGCYVYQTRVETKKQRMEEERLSRLMTEKWDIYDGWLNKCNPYYNKLPAQLKHRFLLRVFAFMESKRFQYHSIEYQEHIPVLISGAAVQVTLGLKNFLIDYFYLIHVVGREYVMKFDNDTYFGHVSKNGICIAWNHFIKGYENYADAINVGLHEMAHAVSYDVFLGQEDQDDARFKERLENFSEKGKPVFRALRKSASHVLDNYGATNFDEFWAVCIETFFENAAALKKAEPDLYNSICELLNQDPLREDKIIDLDLAGIT